MHRLIGQSGNKNNREARMLSFAVDRHWLDWVSKSSMAGFRIGKMAAIGNTECSIGCGLHPLASIYVSSFITITFFAFSICDGARAASRAGAKRPQRAKRGTCYNLHGAQT